MDSYLKSKFLNLIGYQKHQKRWQLGWVGQTASMSNAFIWEYKKTGNKLLLDMAVNALDAYLKFGTMSRGSLISRIDRGQLATMGFDDNTVLDTWLYGEDTLETMKGLIARTKKGLVRRDSEGKLYVNVDACNMGTGADCYFEAYYMLKDLDIEKPEYLEAALKVCEFALQNQEESGNFAKSWDQDGNVLLTKGTIGCFLILPLLRAYEHTGESKYLESAEKAFAFYYSELEETGFTTAGALDTYSVDKESASPLLRVALRLQEVTGKAFYVTAAEKIGWYLTTWMMHYTVEYPADCVIAQMGFDTFGSTAVSTPCPT